MQAVDEQESRHDEAALPWWERAPFSGSAGPEASASEPPGSELSRPAFLSSGSMSSDSPSSEFLNSGSTASASSSSRSLSSASPSSDSSSSDSLPRGFSTFIGALALAAAPRAKAEERASDGGETFLPGDDSFPPGRADSFAWSGAVASAAEDTDGDMNRDTAFFSYESALRAAVRFPAHEPDGDGAAPHEWARSAANDDAQGEEGAQDGMPQYQMPVDRAVFARSATASGSVTAQSPASEALGAKRSASVTLRLSAAECAQLKQRAAEAGLTLSAYVRSCTFEAEALRAQVKQALKELRGQQRGNQDGDLRGDWRGTLRVDTSEKKPPASAMPSLAMHNPLPSDDPLPAGDPRRSWWQLRPSPKNLSAQA
jgi:hypothetical protein